MNEDVVMSVPVQMIAELGRCTMRLSDVLKLGSGSIVALDAFVDRPIDLRVNGKLMARGEIVAADNQFALRICEMVRV